MGLTRQPQYFAPIDRANPIVNGLTFASVGSEIGPRRNMASNAVAVETSTTRLADRMGRLFDYPTGAQSSFGNIPIVSGTDQTVIAWSNPIADASQRTMFSDRNGDQITFAANAEPSAFGTSSGQLCLLIVTGGSTDGFGASGVIDGNPHVYAGARSGASGQLYVDGRPVTTATNGTPGALSFASHIVKLGRHDGVALSLRANLGFVFVWNRRLSDAEVLSVSTNPWQIFQAPRRVLFAPPAAGGDVSVALTGSAATTNIGTLAPSTTVALTGSEATASPGTMVATPTFGLSGQEATTEQGDVTQSRTVPLTGEGMTGAQGNVGVVGDVTVALTGQVMTMAQGDLDVESGALRHFKRRQYIVRRKDELFVFDNPFDAQAFEAQGKPPLVTPVGKGPSRTPKLVKSPAPISLPAVVEAAPDWAKAKLEAMIAEAQYARLLDMVAELEEENELELILLNL